MSDSNSVERFNCNLKQFLNILTEKYPKETKKALKHYKFEEVVLNDKYVKEFLSMVDQYGRYFSSQNEIIFSPNHEVLVGVDFFHIWNHEDTDDDVKNSIWAYLHTLFIFAFEYKNNESFKAYIKRHKGRRENANEEGKILMDIVDAMNKKYEPTKEELEEELEKEENADDSGFKFNFDNPEELLGGKIGELAKEIASEIDPSTLNLENPQELLANLMNGNLDESNDTSGIMGLVRKITDKVQTKLSSGNINESDLFQEAQNTISKLGGKKGKQLMKQFSKVIGKMSTSSPNGQSNVFEQVATQMGLQPPTPEMMEQAQEMFKKMQSGQLSQSDVARMRSGATQTKTRDRLKKKLEERKQQPND